jgi:transcriptional regulator with XRE-family HTH domain
VEMSNRIKQLRKEKKLSGTKLAEMLEISAPYFYDIEKGDRKLSIELASKLSDIFKVTTDYLFNITDVNLYGVSTTNQLVLEEQKNSNFLVKESESWYDIPIEDLAKRELTFRGKKLNDEQKKQFAKIIQAAADMLRE